MLCRCVVLQENFDSFLFLEGVYYPPFELENLAKIKYVVRQYSMDMQLNVRWSAP